MAPVTGQPSEQPREDGRPNSRWGVGDLYVANGMLKSRV